MLIYPPSRRLCIWGVGATGGWMDGWMDGGTWQMATHRQGINGQ